MRSKTLIEFPLSDADERLKGLLQQTAGEPIILMNGDLPIGAAIGFSDEDDWFDFQLEHDPRFLKRIARARAQAAAGQTVRFEDLPE